MLNVDLNRTPTLDAGCLSSDQLSGTVKGFPSCSLLGVAATNEGSGLHAAIVEYYVKAFKRCQLIHQNTSYQATLSD